MPRSRDEVKCTTATPTNNSLAMRHPGFSGPRRSGRLEPGIELEINMRTMMTGALAAAAALGALACGIVTANADYVPPFKGNDTGGIISYAMVGQTDIKALAVDHCAQYGKVVKLTGLAARALRTISK